MSSYVYSAVNNAFYPVALQDDYVASGSWPEDAKEISDAKAAEFMGIPPDGKYRVADKKGAPKWEAAPPLTQSELTAIADAKKASLISEAINQTGLWQTQLLLGIITEKDKVSLTKWMEYIQAVQAVDTSTAPDIDWPKKPA